MELQGLAMHRKLNRWITSDATADHSSTSMEKGLVEVTTMLRQQSAEKRTATTTTTTTTTTTNTTTSITSTVSHRPTTSSSFLTLKDLGNNYHEAYAASWWQSIDRFRTSTAVHKISWLEDAVWKAIASNRGRDIRLTRDWIDLSVEHLSKWWRTAKVEKFDPSYWRLINSLFEYVGRSSSFWNEPVRSHNNYNNNPWVDTIAVVAYVPVSNPNTQRMQPIDILVLGAQVASLIRHSVGRIVVVTDQEYREYVQTHIWPFLVQLLQNDASVLSTNATNWVQDIVQNSFRSRLATNEVTIGSTELTLMDVPSEHGFLGKTVKLVPRACLILLYETLFHNSTTSKAQESLVLGASGRGRWKYVYYTEQDSPLHTRPTVQPNLKTALDQGAVLTPHRLLPAPHESDFIADGVPGDLPQNLYLPAIGNWTHVTVLDAQQQRASCCDRGFNSRDARTLYPKGNNFWFLDGFGKSLPGGETSEEAARVMAEHLKRFSTYQLVRLKDGTGLTLVAGSESSRQCTPHQQYPNGCPLLQENVER
eukprot:scaffold34609_cov146-Amphora_coffeaeformis.AAC.8